MIMSGTLSNISQRLHEVNMLLSTCEQGSLSFGQALLLSLFYRDFSETNTVVEEAESLAEKDADQLLKFSSSLFSESGTYLSLDRKPLQAVDGLERLELIDTCRSRVASVMTFPCLFGWKTAEGGSIANPFIRKQREE